MALHLHQLGYEVAGVDLDLEQSRDLPPVIVRRACNLNQAAAAARRRVSIW